MYLRIFQKTTDVQFYPTVSLQSSCFSNRTNILTTNFTDYKLKITLQWNLNKVTYHICESTI